MSITLTGYRTMMPTMKPYTLCIRFFIFHLTTPSLTAHAAHSLLAYSSLSVSSPGDDVRYLASDAPTA